MTKLSAETTDKDFPDKGILWRGWSDDTLRIIQKKNRPVLLFVADTDPVVWPFLREAFKAMPANARLRELLNDFYSAVFIKADSIPEDLKALGAGSKYHGRACSQRSACLARRILRNKFVLTKSLLSSNARGLGVARARWTARVRFYNLIVIGEGSRESVCDGAHRATGERL